MSHAAASAARVLLLALAAFALALLTRHGLVEPADWTARCDAAPWSAAPCVVRSVVVQTFVDQRIGWVALIFGLLASVWRSRLLAGLGLASGAAGLVLYSAGPAAAGLLLSALVWVRPAAAGTTDANGKP